MKRITSRFFVMLIITLTYQSIITSAYSQVPQQMSYQEVIRDNGNNLVKNLQVGMKISVLQGSATGTPVYVETQTLTTNSNGLVSVVIGGGTPITGTFAGIDWSTGTYYIKTETDPAGGTNYTITGTSQLLSVPYALYAKSSYNALGESGNNTGDMLYFDGDRWANIPIGKQGQYLQLQDLNIPTWTGSSDPIYTIAKVTSITSTTATSGGNITTDGGSSIIARGVCWSTSQIPTIANSKSVDGTGVGLYTSSLTGLTPCTTYYIRAYVTNSLGTIYGSQVSFLSASLYAGNYNLIGYRIRPGNATEPITAVQPFSTVDCKTVTKVGFGNYSPYGIKIEVTTNTMVVGGVTCFKVIATPYDIATGAVVGDMFTTWTGDPATPPAPPANPTEINYYNPVTKVFVLNCWYNSAAGNRIMYEVLTKI